MDGVGCGSLGSLLGNRRQKARCSDGQSCQQGWVPYLDLRAGAQAIVWEELMVESRVLTWREGGKWAIRMDGVSVLSLEPLPKYKAWRTGHGCLASFKHKHFTL